MDTLVPVVVGGLLTLVAGLIGVAVQGRREHAKWVRERRYDAFIAAIGLLRKVAGLMDDAKPLLAKGTMPDAELAEVNNKAKLLRAEWPKASAPLALLGPDRVDEALGEAAKALRGNNADLVRVAEQTMIAAMRKALDIKG